MTYLKSLLFSISCLTLLSSFALARDPIKMSPTNYKVAFENERIRVLEMRYQPGEKVGMHDHPEHVVYITGPGKVKFTYPKDPPLISETKIGEIIWGPAVSHTLENIGKTEFNALLVELKEPRPAAK